MPEETTPTVSSVSILIRRREVGRVVQEATASDMWRDFVSTAHGESRRERRRERGAKALAKNITGTDLKVSNTISTIRNTYCATSCTFAFGHIFWFSSAGADGLRGGMTGEEGS